MLVTSFDLTVPSDLTGAVGVGMIPASLLLTRRMSEVTNVGPIARELEDADEEEDPGAIGLRDVPHGVEVHEVNGPFFFGVPDRLKDALGRLERRPKDLLPRLRRPSAIDATGMPRSPAEEASQ